MEDAGQAAVQTVTPLPQSVRAVERQQPAGAEVGYLIPISHYTQLTEMRHIT